MNHYIKAVLLGATAVLLAACQSAPPPLVLQPTVTNVQAGQAPVVITVDDSRSHNYLLRIEYGDDEAKFAPSTPLLEEAVYAELVANLNASQRADNKLNITIDEAIIKVDQGTVKYTANHQIRMRVEFIYGATTYRKNFNGSASRDGALRADAASLERQFNDLLAELISDVLNDETIRQQLQ